MRKQQEMTRTNLTCNKLFIKFFLEILAKDDSRQASELMR